MPWSISPKVRRAAAYPGGVRYIRNVSRKTAKSSHTAGSIVGGTAGEPGGDVAATWGPLSGLEGSGGGGAAGGGPGGSGGSSGGSEGGAAYSDGGRGWG